MLHENRTMKSINIIIKNRKEGGGMTQVAELLPSKPKALSSNSSTAKRRN
jgi:hypothetical protein